MPQQPAHLRGTRIGIPERVSPAWSGYSTSDVENSPQKVHYDVLRSEGFSRERALEISRQSASKQGYTLEEHRGETGLPSAGDLRSIARFRTPFFGPHAGKLCHVLDDGSLRPVEAQP